MTLKDDVQPRGLLPDPAPRPATYTIISVDDHLVEPPDLFEGRLPARLAEHAPRVVERDDGSQTWLYDGNLYPNIGLNAVVGRPKKDWSLEPSRFDEMRRGCWQVDARVADMDIAGIWASLNFPSVVTGFAGTVFARSTDPEVGLSLVRAFNDWHLEEWAGPYLQRIIPLQITWLNDPVIAAQEVRRNAARGFKAVSFCENPQNLGLPPLSSGHWDPFLSACEETETVVCLHVGSSAQATQFKEISAEYVQTVGVTLFPVSACITCAEWLWSGVPVRFPDLRIAMSEGGIGWVPMMLDRLDYIADHSGSGDHARSFGDLRPSDVLRRNFWFCTIDDPSTIELRHHIGVENIMVESDYPHSDSTWPDTQLVVEKTMGHLPAEELAKITHDNAARLFRHPLPGREGA